ncbi:MAG: hypothetical protein Fur0032_03630 [Terrimicrobiaceae bacterium]
MKTADRLATLFDWPARHAVQVALPAMYVIAALAHIVGLAAFRLSTPNPTPSHRQAATVYALLPVAGGSRAMESALSSADPALFSPSSSEERGIWQLAETDYRPSLQSMMPGLRGLPATNAPPLPPVTPTGPVALSAQPAAPSPTIPPPPTNSVLEFSNPLAGRNPSPLAFDGFSAPEKQGLLPASFLIAVGPEGRVLHVFPLESSGYDALDREADRSLHQLRFEPSSDTTWGTATFLWGADVRRLRLE